MLADLDADVAALPEGDRQLMAQIKAAGRHTTRASETAVPAIVFGGSACGTAAAIPPMR